MPQACGLRGQPRRAGIEGRPGSVRRREDGGAEAACAEVGVESLVFLDQPDGRILQTPELRTAIAREIRSFRPDIVVLLNFQQTWGGVRFNSADHRNLGQAAVDAIGDAGNEWIVPGQRYDGVTRILEFGAHPTHRVDVTDSLEAAIAHWPAIGSTRGPVGHARRARGRSSGRRPLGERPRPRFRVYG